MNNFILKTTEDLTPFIQEVIGKGQSLKITVTGNSMFPLFSHMRDTVTLKQASHYKKYDIILYQRSNGELVLHRIVKKKGEVFFLCGDNQTMQEHPIYPDQVIARVTEFTRKGKNRSVSHALYRLYSFFWCLNLPLRKPVLLFALKLRRWFLEK